MICSAAEERAALGILGLMSADGCLAWLEMSQSGVQSLLCGANLQHNWLTLPSCSVATEPVRRRIISKFPGPCPLPAIGSHTFQALRQLTSLCTCMYSTLSFQKSRDHFHQLLSPSLSTFRSITTPQNRVLQPQVAPSRLPLHRGFETSKVDNHQRQYHSTVAPSRHFQRRSETLS